MNNLKRNNLIYGNCKVYSPDNELMFRCLEERCQWYLERKLAEILEKNPLSIKLNFKPNGKGERHDLLKAERINKCVVCGEENLKALTRHHLIPYEYRKYFPDHEKGHNSFYVVPICNNCHAKYEAKHAVPFKRELSVIYDAPLSVGQSEKNKRLCLILKKLFAIERNYLQEYSIPKEKITALGTEVTKGLFSDVVFKDFTAKYHGEFVKGSMLINLDTLAGVRDLIEKLKLMMEEKPHGQIVVEKCKDIEEFQRKWVKHFIDNMKPKNLPEYLKRI